MKPKNNYKAGSYKKNPSMAYGFAVAKIVAGIPMAALGLSLMAVGVFVIRSFGSPGYYFFQFFSFMLTLSGALLIYGGAATCRLVSVYQKAATWMKFKNRESLGVLSNVTKQDLTRLVRDLRSMVDRGFWPKGHVDLARAEFAIENDGAPAPLLKDGDTVLSEKARLQYKTLIAFPAVWITYSLFRPFPTWHDFAIAGGLSLAVFIIAAVKTPRVRVISEKVYTAPPTPAPVPIKTGNANVDELLNTATGYIAELNELSLSITNEKMVLPVGELLNISRQIFSFVEKQPEKARQVRQFMNYYLPTTIKLLQSYKDFSAEPLKGENIRSSIAKIEESMDGIVETFRREHDNLYSDKATDITVDIDVMLSMMRGQGISSDFAGTQANKRDTEN